MLINIEENISNQTMCFYDMKVGSWGVIETANSSFDRTIIHKLNKDLVIGFKQNYTYILYWSSLDSVTHKVRLIPDSSIIKFDINIIHKG